MHKGHLEFIDWAANYDTGGLDMRSLALHEQWITTCPCPVFRVNGTEDYRTTVANIAERFYTKLDEPCKAWVLARTEPLVVLHRMTGDSYGI